MALQGSKRVEGVCLGDKDKLQLHLLILLVEHFSRYSCFINRSLPCKIYFPNGFHIYHSPNHWANEGTVKLFYESSFHM